MAEKREFKPGDRVRVGKCEGVVVAPKSDTVKVQLDDVVTSFTIAAHNVHLIEAAPESPKIRFWTCPAGDHRGTGSVEWRDNVAYCLVPGCDGNSTQPRPVYGEPEAGVEYDEDGEPEPGTERVGWDIAFGCRQTFSREGDGFHYFLSFSDATKRNGCEKRAVTAEQIRAYAYHLLELARPAPESVGYPMNIVIFCDTCGAEHRADYLVSDADGREARFGYARKHLRENEGWSCTADGDFCPDCGPAPVDGTEPSFHGLPEDKTMGVQSEDDPTVLVYPDGSTDAPDRIGCATCEVAPGTYCTYPNCGPAPVDGAAMDARAADRAPCDTPGCPCGGVQ